MYASLLNLSRIATIFQLIHASCTLGVLARALPSKIYGVNLGSWLLIEPWMLPNEWVEMGGEKCNDCSSCIASEFGFAEAYPYTVDTTFKHHWETWFTQDHVNQLANAGINMVRIPLGFWIVEALVDRGSEYYARGGMLELQRGLSQLNSAGIAAVLDHQALPGVSSPHQGFAGRCTNAAGVQFYTSYNYHRALVWTAVMTALSHVDPNFGSVVSIQAMNEPIMNANLTPGLGDFNKGFVQTMRAVEHSLGIPNSFIGLNDAAASMNVTEAIATTASSSSLAPEIRAVLEDAIPIFADIALNLNINTVLDQNGLRPLLGSGSPLTANFMDVSWQYNNPSNPADAAFGPQAYDNHLYYSFGGVADSNEEAYMASICNLDRIKNDAALRNTPLWFGEWSLATQFSATDEFLKKWADAQKYTFGQGAGWFFWNFRIEDSQNNSRQWSYLEGVRLGYLTQDPSKFNDPHVCDPYIQANNTTSSTSSRSLVHVSIIIIWSCSILIMLMQSIS